MRSFPSCVCCSPRVSLCVVTPPSFRSPAEMGPGSSALAPLGNGTEGHSHSTGTPELDRKRRFFVVSLCVLCHKLYMTLLHIQTLMLRVVERSSGNDTTAGGEEASPNKAAHNVVLIIQLPLISPSASLSHTCTKRLIFG